MSKQRQDAWTKDEDVLLAETVLQFIRNGKTQLDAFKQTAEQLSRTSAACGFRWNATVRKQYVEAVKVAKDNRKLSIVNEISYHNEEVDKQSIESAITIFKKLYENSIQKEKSATFEQANMLTELEQTNLTLKKKLERYEQAWREMNKLWRWIENEERH